MKASIYLFYGRPAYRSHRGSRGGEPIVLCPVCFVFKPRTVSQVVYRVYPCDTGAVAADRFTPEILAGDLPRGLLVSTYYSAVVFGVELAGEVRSSPPDRRTSPSGVGARPRGRSGLTPECLLPRSLWQAAPA